MDQERRGQEKRLAYVRRYKDGYRGHYLDNGRYRGGPIFSSQREAHAWAVRKREELERRSPALPAEAPSADLAATRIDPHHAKWFDPSNARTARAFQTIPLCDPGQSAEESPRPAIIRRSRASVNPPELEDPAPAAALPAQAPSASVESLRMLDSFVHDFVGSLHGATRGEPADDAGAAQAERFRRFLDAAPRSQGQVLGPPVFFGASPDIGLESALGFLGSLRKTGILRVQSADTLFTVSIVNGDVVHGVSYPRPEPELLGNLLVARGTIERERLDRFFAEHGSSPARIGEALEQQALVSTTELQDALLHQLRLLFDRLLATRDSVWCFHEGEATLAYIDTRLNVIGVLLESARKTDEGMVA